MSYQLTSALVGLLIASTILWLIRRDHLHIRHALWWLLVAIAVVVLGMFPKIIDWLAPWVGVNYPPTLLFFLGMAMILLKMLLMDIEQSQLERKIRRLIQQLAIVAGEKTEKSMVCDNELKETLAELTQHSVPTATQSSPNSGREYTED